LAERGHEWSPTKSTPGPIPHLGVTTEMNSSYRVDMDYRVSTSGA
jgi:hypothetical protein